MTVRPHDLGGARGFGRVPIEIDEPVFHAEWEASVVTGILTTMGADLYNVDQFRECIDDLDPLSYISFGYYRRWLHTLEANCLRAGVFSAEQIEERMQAIADGEPLPAGSAPTLADHLRRVLHEGVRGSREVAREPRFEVGGRVRGRVLDGERHSRIPRYAQGRAGTIQRVHGTFPFPDTNRRGEGEQPEHVYSVRFAGSDLWPGEETPAWVYLDLWESYLEAG
jgi:nitrile hydratase